MRLAAQTGFQSPLIEMNTTPLIDVLLVLLVMFIITIPIQSHAVKLDLPGPTDMPFPPPDPVKNELGITKTGTLLWNGSPVSDEALRQELRVTQQMRPTPELHLRPDPEAPYGAVDELLGLIKREHVQRVGFVGNEAYANR
jgi:biopolymer transport protein ExbD